MDATNWIQDKEKEPPRKVLDLKIQLVEAFLLHLKGGYRKEFHILFNAQPEKYVEMEKLLTPEQKANIYYNGTYEPCDYLNLLRTYQMFLEQISVISSEEQMQSMDEEERK